MRANFSTLRRFAGPLSRMAEHKRKQNFLLPNWVPYTPEEAVRLLKPAEGDRQLADVIRMARYTGERREELCSLKVEHVKGDRFEIVDAKTGAGIRTVPIHRQLSNTIMRLVNDSADGYVLSGLKPIANGDRGDAIGKRFTRLPRQSDNSSSSTDLERRSKNSEISSRLLSSSLVPSSPSATPKQSLFIKGLWSISSATRPVNVAAGIPPNSLISLDCFGVALEMGVSGAP